MPVARQIDLRQLLRSAFGLLVCLVGPVAADEVLDLTGEWRIQDHDLVRLEHDGAAVRGIFLYGGGECPYGDRRSVYLMGTHSGHAIEGMLHSCTTGHEKLVTDCDLDARYWTTFKATVEKDTISGTYLAEGYRVDKSGERWSCTRDGTYDAQKAFSLVHEQCSDRHFLELECDCDGNGSEDHVRTWNYCVEHSEDAGTTRISCTHFDYNYKDEHVLPGRVDWSDWPRPRHDVDKYEYLRTEIQNQMRSLLQALRGRCAVLGATADPCEKLYRDCKGKAKKKLRKCEQMHLVPPGATTVAPCSERYWRHDSKCKIKQLKCQQKAQR